MPAPPRCRHTGFGTLVAREYALMAPEHALVAQHALVAVIQITCPFHFFILSLFEDTFPFADLLFEGTCFPK